MNLFWRFIFFTTIVALNGRPSSAAGLCAETSFDETEPVRFAKEIPLVDLRDRHLVSRLTFADDTKKAEVIAILVRRLSDIDDDEALTLMFGIIRHIYVGVEILEESLRTEPDGNTLLRRLLWDRHSPYFNRTGLPRDPDQRAGVAFRYIDHIATDNQPSVREVETLFWLTEGRPDLQFSIAETLSRKRVKALFSISEITPLTRFRSVDLFQILQSNAGNQLRMIPEAQIWISFLDWMEKRNFLRFAVFRRMKGLLDVNFAYTPSEWRKVNQEMTRKFPNSWENFYLDLISNRQKEYESRGIRRRPG